jgi:hypothetical protein
VLLSSLSYFSQQDRAWQETREAPLLCLLCSPLPSLQWHVFMWLILVRGCDWV